MHVLVSALAIFHLLAPLVDCPLRMYPAHSVCRPKEAAHGVCRIRWKSASRLALPHVGAGTGSGQGAGRFPPLGGRPSRPAGLGGRRLLPRCPPGDCPNFRGHHRAPMRSIGRHGRENGTVPFSGPGGFLGWVPMASMLAYSGLVFNISNPATLPGNERAGWWPVPLPPLRSLDRARGGPIVGPGTGARGRVITYAAPEHAHYARTGPVPLSPSAEQWRAGGGVAGVPRARPHRPPLGDERFLERLEGLVGRVLKPQKGGRPRKQ